MNLFRVLIYIFVGCIQNNRNLTIDFGCIFSLRLMENDIYYLNYQERISTLIHFFSSFFFSFSSQSIFENFNF